MTYGRSICRALDSFGIDRTTWSALAQDRAAWRGAVHGALIDSGRSVRVAALKAVHLIDIANADARAAFRHQQPKAFLSLCEHTMSQNHVESYFSELAQQACRI